MAGSKPYGGGNNMTLHLLQNDRHPCSSEVLDSLWLHTSDPPPFQGSKSVVDFENGNRGSSSNNNNRVIMTDHRPFFQGIVEKEENCDEDYDACFHQIGSSGGGGGGSSKKRRLTSEQVQFLERNFEIENKLEPERKVQLAKELGLQPRQVAIWFQNRRARFKTKQLEKEYGALKASYDKLKGDYDNLLQQNHKFKQEVNSLKNKLIPRDNNNNKEKGNSSSVADAAPTTAAVVVNSNSPHKEEEEPIMDLISISISNSEDDGSNKLPLPILVTCKQHQNEDANSAKSDVLDDSDSPQYCTDIGNNNNIINNNSHLHHHSSSSSFVEPADDSSQDDEEDNLSTENLLTFPCLPKVEEDACYHDDDELAPPDEKYSCGFGFPIEDQAFCFWPY